MFPPSDRCKPIIEALLAYPDTGTEANHLEIFRGVAQVVRSAVGDRQPLGERFVSAAVIWQTAQKSALVFDIGYAFNLCQQADSVVG